MDNIFTGIIIHAKVLGVKVMSLMIISDKVCYAPDMIETQKEMNFKSI
jgi:hypothetical protein